MPEDFDPSARRGLLAGSRVGSDRLRTDVPPTCQELSNPSSEQLVVLCTDVRTSPGSLGLSPLAARLRSRSRTGWRLGVCRT